MAWLRLTYVVQALFVSHTLFKFFVLVLHACACAVACMCCCVCVILGGWSVKSLARMGVYPRYWLESRAK